MLTSVEVRTSQGSSLMLNLEDDNSGVTVEKIEGLDPVKATLVSSSFANLDGQQFHSARREARNITMRLGLEPVFISDTVQDLRRRLYGFFMPKSTIFMQFTTGEGETREIYGVVESFETPLFTKDPGVDVSIMCFDPDFIDSTLATFSGSTTSANVEVPIDYEGTVETGIVLKLHVDRTLGQFTVYHRPPDGTLRSLDFVASLSAGDEVEISTVVGNKYAHLTRAGVQSSLLYAVLPQSNWIELQPGDNLFHVYATGVSIPYDVQYYPRYGGL